jgi:tetratricopeptide (TPR) repeat protein
MSRRLAWYLWTIPLVILLVVVAVKLIGLSVTNQSAINAYNNGQYERSITTSESLMDFNVIEPYIPYFNRGDAYAASEMYVESIDDFERALELAPEQKKCDVRVNLALSWENLGDIYAEGGFFQGAVLLYEAAEKVIAEGGEDCTPPQQSEEDLQESKERVEEKKEQAEEQRDAATEGDEDGESTGDKLDDLKEQEEQGAGEKANGDTRDRGEGSGGSVDKPW